MAFKMAERTPADGPVSVTREGDRIRVTAATDGNRESILMTEYNAARILGLLSLILEAPLSKSVATVIKL
jgi:hypothetical protein